MSLIYMTELAASDDQLTGWGAKVVMDGISEGGHRVVYVPLASGRCPLETPDAWLVSLPYAGNVRMIREFFAMVGQPYRRKARSWCPVIIGGHAVINSTPLLDCFDAVYVGEADDNLPGLAKAITSLADLACVPGVDTGEADVHFQIATTLDRRGGYAAKGVDGVGDVTYLEIARGCKAGCRFCEIGWLYGYTERPRDQTAEMMGAHDNVVLSAPDTDGVSWFGDSLVDGMYDPRWRSTRVFYYLRSQQTARSGKRGRIRFGVEGVTPRLRQMTSKPVSDADLLTAMQRAVDEGYRMIRLFFIAGLPTETESDRQHMRHVLGMIDEVRGLRHWKAIDIKVTGLSPQPLTPMQRCGIGDALAGIKSYRRSRRTFQRADQRWRQVMVDTHSTEADVLKHMWPGELARYLDIAGNGRASSRDVRIWAETAGIDYVAIMDGYRPSDTLPWHRTRHPIERRLARAEVHLRRDIDRAP